MYSPLHKQVIEYVLCASHLKSVRLIIQLQSTQTEASSIGTTRIYIQVNAFGVRCILCKIQTLHPNSFMDWNHLWSELLANSDLENLFPQQ